MEKMGAHVERRSPLKPASHLLVVDKTNSSYLSVKLRKFVVSWKFFIAVKLRKFVVSWKSHHHTPLNPPNKQQKAGGLRTQKA
jgi:hypothetical protein